MEGRPVNEKAEPEQPVTEVAIHARTSAGQAALRLLKNLGHEPETSEA
jgi:hypothetical protein